MQEPEQTKTGKPSVLYSPIWWSTFGFLLSLAHKKATTNCTKESEGNCHLGDQTRLLWVSFRSTRCRPLTFYLMTHGNCFICLHLHPGCSPKSRPRSFDRLASPWHSRADMKVYGARNNVVPPERRTTNVQTAFCWRLLVSLTESHERSVWTLTGQLANAPHHVWCDAGGVHRQRSDTQRDGT